MKYLLLSALLLIGCSTTSTNQFEIYKYEGLATFSANAVRAEEITSNVGALPVLPEQESPPAKFQKRVYYITASWCGPCQRFKRDVLPNLGLTYGPKNSEDTSWDKDILIVDYDKNANWIRRVLKIEPSGLSVPTFILELEGFPKNRNHSSKVFYYNGFMTKEQFENFYGQK